jgi:Zn-dependent membrane protease YugP
MFPFFWNPTYWLFVAPALLLMLYAQWRVRSAYNKWGEVANSQGIPGAQAAQRLMAENGLYGINVSVASVAIVAHEIGHASQDATGYALLRLRAGLVPAVNFGAQLGPILFIVGYFLQFSALMWVGVIFFSMAFVFALVTLPVEINASSRALRMLKTSGLLVSDEERKGARAVLSAAALTYVAALLTALFQLLYYVMLASGGRRRR